MAELFSDKEYDTILDNGTICNYYFWPDDFYGSALKEIRQNPGLLANYKSNLIPVNKLDDYYKLGNIIVKVIYLPKMGIEENKKIVEFQVINKKN
jgi:hypothetical protein